MNQTRKGKNHSKRGEKSVSKSVLTDISPNSQTSSQIFLNLSYLDHIGQYPWKLSGKNRREKSCFTSWSLTAKFMMTHHESSFNFYTRWKRNTFLIIWEWPNVVCDTEIYVLWLSILSSKFWLKTIITLHSVRDCIKKWRAGASRTNKRRSQSVEILEYWLLMHFKYIHRLEREKILWRNTLNPYSY